MSRANTSPAPHHHALLLLLLVTLLGGRTTTIDQRQQGSLLLGIAAAEDADGLDGSSATMDPTEQKAVLDVVSGLLDDPDWATLHPRPCTDTPWPGIQCEFGANNNTHNTNSSSSTTLHVTKIHIGPDVAGDPPCRPSATISASLLHRLPYLKSLSLFSCFTGRGGSSSSLPPDLFTGTSSLEQLVLNSNPGLGGVIPGSVSRLSRTLRVLSLSQNGLTGKVPPELGDLPKLQQLDISFNNLTGTIPSQLGQLSRLAILDLSFNELRGPIPSSAVAGLLSLQKLDLSHNVFSGTIPPELGRLGASLVLLDLSRNRITGPIPDALRGLKTSLEYLMLDNNPVATAIPGFLGEMDRLSVLGMSGCGLLGPIPESLGRLTKLTALALDRNRLTGSVPLALGDLPSLGQLNLSQNRLTGEVGFKPEFVRRLGKRLDVRDNDGLCADPKALFGNTSSSSSTPAGPYFAAPPCGGNSGAASRSWRGSDGANSVRSGGASFRWPSTSLSLSCYFFAALLLSFLVGL